MDSYHDLWHAIPAIQLHFSCEVCKQRYMKGWIQVSPNQCLFCRTYCCMENPSRVDLMRDIDWAFLQSGLEDKREFDSDYLNQIHRWANAMGIPYTQHDWKWEEERRKYME